MKYAEAKIEKRRLKKLKNSGLHDATKIEPIKLSGDTEVKPTQDVAESEEELKMKPNEIENEFRKIEIEMVKERINGPFFISDRSERSMDPL